MSTVPACPGIHLPVRVREATVSTFTSIMMLVMVVQMMLMVVVFVVVFVLLQIGAVVFE